jgi:cytochrome c oxidase subunit 3
MSAAVATHHHAEHGEHDYQAQLRNNRLGLWLFFFSEAFMFAGLLTARFYLWGTERPELDQTLGLAVTVVLLLSSFSMNRAETAIAHNDRQTFSIFLIITFVLGAAFLIGVVLFEWGVLAMLQGQPVHISPSDGAFGAVIYGMTGMHALHVLSGLIFIGIIFLNGQKGCYNAEEHWGVEACAIWWHYVDLVWVFFYPAIYLMGAAVHPLGH